MTGLELGLRSVGPGRPSVRLPAAARGGLVLVSLCYASLKFLRVKIEKAVWGLQGSLWVAQDSQVIRQLVRRAAFASCGTVKPSAQLWLLRRYRRSAADATRAHAFAPNTEEEKSSSKAAAGPKDHVMPERRSAAEMIKAGIFVVFFAASGGFTASQELIVSTPDSSLTWLP